MTVLAHTALYILNWILVRLLFRLSVEGQNHLPAAGPFILTPNHASPFDPPILGAAIPLATLRQTYWAGKRSTVLRNPLRRLLSWLTRIIPIGDEVTALAPAVAILEQGDNLIWFPEGKRSVDGRIQTFKPGIGLLLTRCDVPVVRIFIHGAHAAHAALPPGARVPRVRTSIRLKIGPPESAHSLGLTPSSTVEDVNRAVETLRRRIEHLQDSVHSHDVVKP